MSSWADEPAAGGPAGPVGDGLVPRPWIDDAVDRWWAGGDGVLLVTGGPGSGKTVVLEAITARHRDDVALAHFCRARDDRTLNPLRLVETLSAGLAAGYPAFAAAVVADPTARTRVEVGDVTVRAATVEAGAVVTGVAVTATGVSAREAFDRLVRRPWDAVVDGLPDGPRLVVVDALDESLGWPGAETVATLVAAMAAAPPRGLRLLVSCRPVPVLLRQLPGSTRLDLDAHRAEARDDVRRFLRERGACDVEELATAADGNLLVAYHLSRAPAGARSAPVELDELYADFVERELRRDVACWRRELRPVLALLGVGRGHGLTVDDLALLADLAPAVVRDALDDCGSFVRSEDGRWAVFHESFREFLLRHEDEFGAGPRLDLAVAERVRELFPDWWTCEMPYAVSTVLGHLTSAAALGGPTGRRALVLVEETLLDARWLVRRVDAGELDALVTEVRAVSLLASAPPPATAVAATLLRQAPRLVGGPPPGLVAQQLALGAASLGEPRLQASARSLCEHLGAPFVDEVWTRGPRPGGLRMVVPAAHAGVVRSVGVSPDGAGAFSVGDTRLRLWDLAAAAPVTAVEDVVAADVDWSRRVAYVVGADSGLARCDLATGRRGPVELPADSGPPAGSRLAEVRLAPAGDRLAALSENGVRVLDTSSWAVTAAVLAPGAGVVLDRDLTTVVAVEAGRLRCVTSQGERSVETGTAWEPGYFACVTLSADGGVVAWTGVRDDGGEDVTPFVEVRSTRDLGHLVSVTPAAAPWPCLNPDGSRLAVFDEGGRFQVLETATGRLLVDDAVPTGSVHSLVYGADGEIVRPSGTGDILLCTDGGTEGGTQGGTDGTVVVPVWSVAACAVSPDGRLCVAGDPEGNLHVWDLDEARRSGRLPESRAGAVTSAVPVPGTATVWTADTGGTVRLLDAVDGGVVAEHDVAPSVRVHGCAPDGTSLVLGVPVAPGEDGAGREEVLVVRVDPWTVLGRWTTDDRVHTALHTRGGWLVVVNRTVLCEMYDEAGRPWPPGAGTRACDVRRVGEDALLVLTDDGTALVHAGTGRTLRDLGVVSGMLNGFVCQNTAVSGDGRFAVLSTPDLYLVDLEHGDVTPLGPQPVQEVPGEYLDVALDRTGERALVSGAAGVEVLRRQGSALRPEQGLRVQGGSPLLVTSVDAGPQLLCLAAPDGELRVHAPDAPGAPDGWHAWLDVRPASAAVLPGGLLLALDESGRLLGLRLVEGLVEGL